MRLQTLLVPTAIALMALPAGGQEPASATAAFLDIEGAEIGTVTLSQTEAGVSIAGNLTEIAVGDHGFHFHETGNCDASTAFESAGKHFNPTAHEHGIENPAGPHAGDLPNVTAAQDGSVSVDLTTELISLIEGDTAYVFDGDGTSLVLHADPDDMQTDPSGNSGDRIACAVIEAAP